MKKKASFLDKYFKDYAESDFYLNEIDYNLFDAEKFNEKFKIVKITYNKLDDKGNPKYLSFKSRLFADLLDKEKILSVSYVGGCSVFILLNRKSEFDWYDLADYLEERDSNFEREYYSYEFVEVKPMDVYHKMQLLNERRVAANKKAFCCYDDIENRRLMDTVYRLLLNALARKKGSEFDDGVSNVDGQLYLYVDRDRTYIRTLNVTAKDGLLDFKVVTFKKYEPKKDNVNEEDDNADENTDKENSDKSKKPLDKYKLILGTNDSVKLERCFEPFDKSDKIFIQKSKPNSRHVVYFDNLSFKQKKANKIEIIHNLIEDFNYEYDGIAKLGFVKRKSKFKKITKNTDSKKDASLDYQTLKSINVVALDDVILEEKDVEVFLENLRNPDFNLDVSDISRDFSFDKPNIVIINDAQYYTDNKKKDIKLDIPDGVLHQCVTVKNIGKSVDSITRKLLSELYIKKELFNNKIFKWNFGECEFYLGIKVKVGKEEYKSIHALMKIDAAGHFEIIDDESKIDKIYTLSLGKFKKTGNICIVKKDDKLNELEEMDYILMPQRVAMEKAIHYALDKKNSLRSKDRKFLNDKEAYPYQDKLVFMINDDIHYSVGKPESSLRFDLDKLNRVYRIISLNDTLDTDSRYILEIIDMLDNCHIRSNNAETVRPYPFKHILEYLRMKYPDIKDKIRF